MVPYRPLHGLSGYNPINEIKIAISSVISDIIRVFASYLRLRH